MANWISYIKDDLGTGGTTRDGMITNGPTHGVQLSQELPPLVGFTTIGSAGTLHVAGTLKLDGQLKDGDDAFGTSGQVLSSDGTDTKWVSSGSLAAGAASQVAINDDSNANQERFITFVDASSGNNNVKTDPQFKYNPSTNTITTTNIAGNVTGDVTGDLTGDVTGNISGNAGTATVLQTARTIGGVSFNGSGNIDLPGVNTGGTQGTSGNAATATRLATTRNIGGVGFNGTGNIDLPGVNTGGTQNTSGNAATATVLATSRNFSISGDITANSISFNGSGAVALSATIDNDVVDKNCMANEAVGEPELHISNDGTNGQFLQKQSGNSGGLTWATVDTSASGLSGSTLASGVTASSLTSLGDLNSLSVSGTLNMHNGNVIQLRSSTNSNIRGYIQATETDDAHLIIATTGGEDISFRDGGLGGTVNMRIRGNGNVIITGDCSASSFTGDISGSSGSCTGNSATATTASNSSTSRIRTDSGDAYHNIVFVDSATDNQDQTLKMDDETSRLQWNPHQENLVVWTAQVQGLRQWSNGSLGSSGQFLRSNGGNSWTWENVFVTGMIMIWSGSTGSIPSGWVLCNGSNSTPDLRNRFVIGAGNSYNVGATGGYTDSIVVSHNHSTNNHNHSFSDTSSNNGSHQHTENAYRPYYDSEDSETGWSISTEWSVAQNNKNIGNNTGGHTHSVSGTTGNSNPSTNSTGVSGSSRNLPPYYALCYIMKT